MTLTERRLLQCDLTPTERRLLRRLYVAATSDAAPVGDGEWAGFVADRRRELTPPLPPDVPALGHPGEWPWTAPADVSGPCGTSSPPTSST